MAVLCEAYRVGDACDSGRRFGNPAAAGQLLSVMLRRRHSPRLVAGPQMIPILLSAAVTAQRPGGWSPLVGRGSIATTAARYEGERRRRHRGCARGSPPPRVTTSRAQAGPGLTSPGSSAFMGSTMGPTHAHPPLDLPPTRIAAYRGCRVLEGMSPDSVRACREALDRSVPRPREDGVSRPSPTTRAKSCPARRRPSLAGHGPPPCRRLPQRPIGWAPWPALTGGPSAPRSAERGQPPRDQPPCQPVHS